MNGLGNGKQVYESNIMSNHPTTGKGDWKRPSQITIEEERIRWQLAYHKITFATFRKKYLTLKKRGLIRRSGRPLK